MSSLFDDVSNTGGWLEQLAAEAALKKSMKKINSNLENRFTAMQYFMLKYFKTLQTEIRELKQIIQSLDIQPNYHEAVEWHSKIGDKLDFDLRSTWYTKLDPNSASDTDNDTCNQDNIQFKNENDEQHMKDTGLNMDELQEKEKEKKEKQKTNKVVNSNLNKRKQISDGARIFPKAIQSNVMSERKNNDKDKTTVSPKEECKVGLGNSDDNGEDGDNKRKLREKTVGKASDIVSDTKTEEKEFEYKTSKMIVKPNKMLKNNKNCDKYNANSNQNKNKNNNNNNNINTNNGRHNKFKHNRKSKNHNKHNNKKKRKNKEKKMFAKGQEKKLKLQDTLLLLKKNVNQDIPMVKTSGNDIDNFINNVDLNNEERHRDKDNSDSNHDDEFESTDCNYNLETIGNIDTLDILTDIGGNDGVDSDDIMEQDAADKESNKSCQDGLFDKSRSRKHAWV